MQMYTDPKRIRADIPGTVEGNPVFMYHDAFNPDSGEVEDLKTRYRAGKVGDVEVKTKLAKALNARLDPMRARRADVLARPSALHEILIRRIAQGANDRVGNDGARAVDREVEVPYAMNMEQPEFESILEAYPVRLQNFEGPLDLLLHLIKKHEVNIYDIPIALVTHQYLEYIDLMQEMNLDVAGEFLVMAATLIHIKSTHAAAASRSDPGRSGRGSPRRAHSPAARASEVQGGGRAPARARDACAARSGRAPTGRSRRLPASRRNRKSKSISSASISAFRSVVERSKQRPAAYSAGEQIPIETRIEQLLAQLSETEACGFEDLFTDVRSRAGMIVTFLALLEMIRLKLIRVFQTNAVGPIRVYKRARPADAPRPLGDPEASSR